MSLKYFGTRPSQGQEGMMDGNIKDQDEFWLLYILKGQPRTDQNREKQSLSKVISGASVMYGYGAEMK